MNIFSSIISAVFPPKCIVCDAIKEEIICTDCMSKINWLKGDFFNANLLHPVFNSARSLAAYDGAWGIVIHNFKYNKQTDMAEPLGALLAESVDLEYDLIVPVPLHKKRLRERGFNQSALLAKIVARLTGFPCCFTLLERVKDIKPQVGLSQNDRVENVKGAFLCKQVKGGHILLIDDVITTGATVNECAKALKNAGAKVVDVLTVARA